MINGTLLVDFLGATGKDPEHTPNSLKCNSHEDVDGEFKIPLEQFLNATGDPWTNPCSGGVLGWRIVCDKLGRSHKTLKRNRWNPSYSYIRWVGSGNNTFPVSNVESLYQHGYVLDARYTETKFQKKK